MHAHQFFPLLSSLVGVKGCYHSQRQKKSFLPHATNFLLLCLLTLGCTPSPQSQIRQNITYTTYSSPQGQQELLLDLYLPASNRQQPSPVILYIHGGGWLKNSKANCPAPALVEAGYAVACINYRYSSQALFPAQIEDVKKAVVWLKNNANKYNLNPDKIGVLGDSAGGHLSALLGTSSAAKALEDPATFSPESTKVQAVAAWYPPTDFTQVPPAFDEPITEEVLRRNQDKPWFHYTEATNLLLGGPISQKRAEAKLANPITYVDANDPPFLLIHGELDRVVPISQSEILYQALKAKQVPVKFLRIADLKHSFVGEKGEQINPQLLEPTLTFFDRYLQNK